MVNKVIKEVKTPMGVFKKYENGYISTEVSEDWWEALKKALKGEVYEENGGKGIKYKSEIIFPPFYDEIGILHNPGRVYLVRGGRYDLYYPNGYQYYGGYYYNDDHFIFKNGNMGWFKNGRTVVKPLYNEVRSWGYLKLFETRYGNDYRYFTEDGREVLTYRRPIKDGDGSPFWMRSDEGDSFCVLECPPVPSLPDCNIWDFDETTTIGLDSTGYGRKKLGRNNKSFGLYFSKNRMLQEECNK